MYHNIKILRLLEGCDFLDFVIFEVSN